MAKSKSGGTRSYIRGRVGADVYSIGRDAKGAKQQVVRSLAETVANPQTIAQMRGRMIMSTVMQAVSAFRPIIDHSFDNVPTGQPSISEFISRNYALVKADVAANPTSGNAFGLNAYHVKGVQGGAWVISAGDVAVPAALMYDDTSGVVISGTAAQTTLADFMGLAGIAKGDYITGVAFDRNKGVHIWRVNVKDDADVTTVLSAENIASLFDIDSEDAVTITFGANSILFEPTISGSALSEAGGLIMSVKTTSGYKHSSMQLPVAADITKPAADDVLPTYPVGTEMFLNGGEL